MEFIILLSNNTYHRFYGKSVEEAYDYAKTLDDSFSIITGWQYVTKRDNSFPELESGDIIEVWGEEEMRFVCNDECEVLRCEGLVHPDEDQEFQIEHITKVWKQRGDDLICVYMKEK